MCGICGIVDFSGRPPDAATVEILCDELRHRGPDDSGIHSDEIAALGARRLSIIDLSEQGHMPMTDGEGRWITYNGEVYNHREIRAELEAKGHRFRSRCDTEVVLRAYAQWGDACVERMAGMFAFALWDAPRRRLFAARDRLGVKPLFYWRDGRRLAFASEVGGLYRFARPEADAVDPLALDYFLAFGYVPPDRCLIRGLHRLPPGHRMVFDESGLRCERYWQLQMRPTLPIDLETALDELDTRLERAVSRRLESDVPLGSFLSGGIDSGLVTAFAARASDEPLRTFSVGFGGASNGEDERPLARLVAERYGTRHTEIEVGADVGHELLHKAVRHVGEPFGDVSILPTYLISCEARRLVTVALSGDGGDESFAGYRNVMLARQSQRLRERLPAPLRRLAAGLGHPLVGRLAPPVARAGRWFGRYVGAPVASHFDLPEHWASGLRRSLYTGGALRALADRDALDVVEDVQRRSLPVSDAELHLFTDLHLRLPGGYLVKVDIASNMTSLEVRSPFLDHELVEFAARLPVDLKLLGGRQKGLLRRLAARHLPSPLVDAPKRGFAPRTGEWLRGDWAGPLRDAVEDSSVARAGWLRQETLRRVLEEHRSGRVDPGQRLWSFLALETWWRMFIDRRPDAGSPA